MPSLARRSSAFSKVSNQPLRPRLASERPHVLIVTSDEDLRVFLAEGLLIGGFWTSTVASGIQAIEVFRLRTFDVVLLDLDVQGFGGAEILRRLRGTAGKSTRSVVQPALTDAPIILVSADAEAMTEDQARQLGAEGLRVPPIELEQLIPYLFGVVDDWRDAHPGRPYADQANRISAVATTTTYPPAVLIRSM